VPLGVKKERETIFKFVHFIVVTIVAVISNRKAKPLSLEICPRERDHSRTLKKKIYGTSKLL